MKCLAKLALPQELPQELAPIVWLATQWQVGQLVTQWQAGQLVTQWQAGQLVKKPLKSQPHELAACQTLPLSLPP